MQSAEVFSDSSSVYAQYEERPSNYSQNLWKTNHNEFHKPGERFINKECGVYHDQIASGGQGPLEGAPVPKGLIKFIEWVCNRFDAHPTQHSTASDIAWRVLCFLDYTEPYYLFYNSCVQLVPNQLKYTYRFRESGGVLPPDAIEIFEVMKGWDFGSFKQAWAALTHPAVDAVLAGQFVRHKKRGDAVTKEDIYQQLCEIVWGDSSFVDSWVEEWLFDNYENMEFTPGMEDEEAMSAESFANKDMEFWKLATIAALIWFRSEHALPFLCEFHPIYYSILGWDKRSNSPYLVEGSGGESVVYGWDVYSHQHLIVEKNAPPGTCDNCHLPLHCTKLINAAAVSHPICSCGQAVDVVDIQFHRHGGMSGFHSPCGPYRDAHPPVSAFGCQRCLGLLIKKRDPGMACEQSPKCPNTQCQWHGGQSLYIRSLTDRRKMLLTHIRS